MYNVYVYWCSHVWPVDVYFCWASGCIEKDICIVLPTWVHTYVHWMSVEEDIYVLYICWVQYNQAVYRKIRTGVLMDKTMQRHNTENSKQIFPEKELRGLSPNFHIYVSVSDLYIGEAYSAAIKYADRSWEYINGIFVAVQDLL